MINDQELVDEQEQVEAEESLEELEARRDGGADQEVSEEEPLAEARYLDVIAAVHATLEGKAVDEATLAAMSDVEREAVEFLRQVVEGRTKSNEFMFAERRLAGLNQVLAALQPVLSVGGMHQVLTDSLIDVVEEIEELRQKLVGLEDAEEEVFHEPETAAEAGDKDDDDDEPIDAELADEKRIRKNAAKAAADKAAGTKPDPSDADQPKKPATSTVFDPGAPELPEAPKPPSIWEPEDRVGGKR